MTSDEYKNFIKDILALFPKLQGTPDLYYIKEGKIFDHVDANAIDISIEENFNDWIDKNQLNADKDYKIEETD